VFLPLLGNAIILAASARAPPVTQTLFAPTVRSFCFFRGDSVSCRLTSIVLQPLLALFRERHLHLFHVAYRALFPNSSVRLR